MMRAVMIFPTTWRKYWAWWSFFDLSNVLSEVTQWISMSLLWMWARRTTEEEAAIGFQLCSSEENMDVIQLGSWQWTPSLRFAVIRRVRKLGKLRRMTEWDPSDLHDNRMPKDLEWLSIFSGENEKPNNHDLTWYMRKQNTLVTYWICHFS